jgi:hypothetical protein
MFGMRSRRGATGAAALLVAAALAIPALASSGDGVGGDGGEPAGFPADRAILDDALRCLSDRGFGTPTPDDGVEGPGMFIPRSVADSSEFKDAADECGLPEPPTDAEIRDLACSDARARDGRRDD